MASFLPTTYLKPTNAYELLPTSSPSANRASLPLSEFPNQWKTWAKRKWWAVGILILAPMVFVCFGEWNDPLGITSHDSESDEPPSFFPSSPEASNSNSSSHWQVGAIFDDHPVFELPATFLLPSNTPLPYPSPSSECLLHLYTLSDANRFDASLCPAPTEVSPIDVVITFVNGTSDPYFVDAYDATLAEFKKAGARFNPASRHYSNMGEMKFALRSVGRYLKGERMEQGWIRGIGADFVTDGLGERERLGQAPSWMDWEAVSRPWERRMPKKAAKGKKLAWAFHSEIFLGEQSWKQEALPTFNSFAIESQIHNLPSLSPNFISMNDDFFLLRPLSASDFHTNLFGPVFRLQYDLKVTGKQTANVGDPGEWGGLEWAAFVLGRRHPNKGFEYLNHLPKTLSQPHLHELSLTFRDALLDSSKRRFREQKTGGADIEIAFLLTHYVRQRFREALLYSFAVARPINGTESVWGKREKDELRALEIESWKGQAGTFMSRAGWNDKGYKHVLRKAGEDELMATTFDFVTASGPAKNRYDIGYGKPINLDKCLGDWWTSEDDGLEIDSVDMFKRLAFGDSDCGDLLLSAILSRSTEPGLTPLLPRPNTFFPPSSYSFSNSSIQPAIYNVPHLPLTPTWEEADFSLASMLPKWNGLDPEGVDMRDWIVRLLGRYRYSTGETPSHFTSIRDTSSVGRLTTFLRSTPSLALLAVNDDIRAGISDQQRTNYVSQVKSWGETFFPGKEHWERDD